MFTPALTADSPEQHELDVAHPPAEQQPPAEIEAAEDHLLTAQPEVHVASQFIV
jgi:hypothetical protein